MPAVKTHNAHMRRRLLIEAARILNEHGAEGVTVRRVADAVGTSTMAVYTLFGDKGGLINALFVDGFGRLGRALSSAMREEDPLGGLLQIGIAYRRFALKNPRLYEVLFGRGIDNSDDHGAHAAAQAPFDVMNRAVARCVEAGLMRPIDIEQVTYHLWGVAHGLVSLELNGCIGGTRRARDHRYLDALMASGAAYVAAQPAESRGFVTSANSVHVQT